jgi:hypothetical protein
MDDEAVAAGVRRLLAFGVAVAAPERRAVLLDCFDASPGAAARALCHTYDADVHSAQVDDETADAPCLTELEFVPGLCGLPLPDDDQDGASAGAGAGAVSVWELTKTRHASGSWVWSVQDVVTRRVWAPVGMLASLRPPLPPSDGQCALARFFRTQPAWEVFGAMLLALRPWRVHLPPCCYATLTGARARTRAPTHDHTHTAVGDCVPPLPFQSAPTTRDSAAAVMLRQCLAVLAGEGNDGDSPWRCGVEVQEARRAAAASVGARDMTSVIIVAPRREPGACAAMHA